MSSTALDNDEITEYFDSIEKLAATAEQLAKLIRESRHCVVYTGAGISTSAGISDFRGPNGVWTLRAQGKPAISRANFKLPTLCHMAIKKLVDQGLVKFVVSQNTDGLHVRSGLPIDRLAELHGNTNKEYCKQCGKVYHRDFGTREARDVHDHRTSRKCIQCHVHLHDTIINFGESLPFEEFRKAEENSRQCDLAIVLGTSMRVTPAAELPLLARKNGAKLVICNLQRTPYDGEAHVLLHANTDDLMTLLLKQLGVNVPDITFEFDFRLQKGLNSHHNTLVVDKSSVQLSALLSSFSVSEAAGGRSEAETRDGCRFGFNCAKLRQNVSWRMELGFNFLQPFVGSIDLESWKQMAASTVFRVKVNASKSLMIYETV